MDLLPGVKLVAKLTYLVAKTGGHIGGKWVIIWSPVSRLVVVRLKTKHNSMWSKAFKMPWTIWNGV